MSVVQDCDSGTMMTSMLQAVLFLIPPSSALSAYPQGHSRSPTEKAAEAPCFV